MGSGDRQAGDASRERGRVHELVVIREERCAKALGEDDVESVGNREVWPVGPGILEQRDQRHPSERPVDQAVQRGCRVSGSEHTRQFPSPQHASDLGREMLGSSERGARWDELAEGLAAGGVSDQLDASGGVDHDRRGRLDLALGTCLGERVGRPDGEADRRVAVQLGEPRLHCHCAGVFSHAVFDELERRLLHVTRSLSHSVHDTDTDPRLGGSTLAFSVPTGRALARVGSAGGRRPALSIPAHRSAGGWPAAVNSARQRTTRSSTGSWVLGGRCSRAAALRAR